MSSYDNVMRGGLKLKGGGGLPTVGGVGKKKKKKSKKKDAGAEGGAEDAGDGAPAGELTLGEEDGVLRAYVVDNRTAAEKRYDEQMEKNQERQIQKMASKSHRDKVRDFNEYLSKLSEHHDIPKVGPG